MGKEARQLLQEKIINRKPIALISKQINVSIRKHREKLRLGILSHHIEKYGSVKKRLKTTLRQYHLGHNSDRRNDIKKFNREKDITKSPN